jgi:hypothetical protein
MVRRLPGISRAGVERRTERPMNLTPIEWAFWLTIICGCWVTLVAVIWKDSHR